MLKDLTDKIVTERHHLVVDEEDITKVLVIINKHHKYAPELRVGNCGWADDTKKWFIHFTTTREKWEILRKELGVVRVYDYENLPKDGKVYSND